jgi:proline iminopeptidase
MHVAVEGADLWVEEDGDGVPLVIPTGAGVEFYRRTLSRRLRGSFHCYFVEMRGTGGSTGSIDGATFGSLADDVEAVRLALGLGPVVTLGQSNHGCIALEHALRHPAGSAGAISVASVLDGRETFALGMARWAAESTQAQKDDVERRTQAMADLQHPMSMDELMVRQYLTIAPLAWRDPDLAWPCWGGFPAGIGTYLPWMATTIAAFDARERLRTLERPLLAICGRYDYVCPVETWEGIEVAPTARLELLADSAHNPQIEDQARFDELVIDFVAAT